ncbi:MAG: Type 1 glutamine amidotransferase-like domain-containing protein [Acholeplasmatales bacterium]|jgi:peptidase E|nr:Type 1 glutamine amidotransferase-like domain-containing protein [Acholeplasmatales bacterium]
MINILTSHTLLEGPKQITLIKNYLKDVKQVVIILYSFFDSDITNRDQYIKYYGSDSDYYKKLVQAFKNYGVSEDKFYIVDYFKSLTPLAIEIIKCADCIYFPGGAPDLFMDRIHKKNIISAITYNKENKIFFGSSAGAMIQFTEFFITPDDKYTKLSYHRGLPLLKNSYIQVHYHKNRTEIRYLNKIKKEEKPIILLKEDSVCIFQNGSLLTGINILHF